METSATSGHAKILPVSKTWFRHYSRDWDVWGIKAYSDHPEMMGSAILQLSGPWNLATTSGGFNIASISGMIERYQSRVVNLTYAILPEVKHIKDLDARGYCMIRIAAAQSIGMISSVTPSSVLQIAVWVAQFGPRLVRDLAEGTVDRNFDIPGRIRDQIAARVSRRQPLLARKLDAAIELNAASERVSACFRRGPARQGPCLWSVAPQSLTRDATHCPDPHR